MGWSQTQLLLGLSFLAGGLHVLSPDHWFPVSVWTWQRRWGVLETLRFSALVFLVHLIAGALMYFALPRSLHALQPGVLFLLSLGMVVVFSLIRTLRFGRVTEVLRSGGYGVWALMMTFSLIGPCEFLLPVLIKSSQLRVEPLLTFAAFGAGTLVFGGAAVLYGNYRWSTPQALPRMFIMARQSSALLPLSAGVLASLALLVRVT